jgi:proteasome lid subunit RPN8/RPN11
MSVDASVLELSQPDERILPLRDPDIKSQIQLKPTGAEPEEEFHIFCSEKVMEEIREYSGTELEREVGGVMLGGYYLDKEARDGQGVEFILIDGYIPAKHGESQHASFKFTHDSGSYITKEQEENYPDSRIVGWHHTHPNFGIFLSSMDIFIQENFFNLHWQVALVVDPCRETLGFLRMKGQGTRPIRSPFYTIRDKKS